MYERQGSSTGRREFPINMADIALRGTAVLFNIQLDALRGLWEMQARSAAALGAPDYSGLFRSGNGGMKKLIETTTDQLLNSVRQTNETMGEMQRQFSRLIEQRTNELSEDMRHGIEELSERTRQGLQQVASMAQKETEEVRRAGQTPEQEEQPQPDAGR